MNIVFHAYKYQGRGIDFGRVLYGWGRKYWFRIGPWIISAESNGRDAIDAKRYRWLKCGGWEVMQDPRMWPEHLRFDGAIDAAMRETSR